MENLIKLLNLLPHYEEIENLLQKGAEAAFILRFATENIAQIMKTQNEVTIYSTTTQESSYLLKSLADKCWERIHTGHFSQVPLEIRQIYALANYFRIFYLLFENLSTAQVEKCSALLDEALLVGSTQNLYPRSKQLEEELTQYFNTALVGCIDFQLPTIAKHKRQVFKCDVPQTDCPSVEVFREQFFNAKQPALLLNTIDHWPAIQKWRDLNYILKIAGNRTVPIEIGSNYATDEWSQQLIKLRDFLKRQFSPIEEPCHKAEIEYLAQHELFDQVPALKCDICIPDYCSLGSTQAPTSVDIKAWLGPKGTVSPLHQDPKHNLLCQVFGIKKIILAAPTDTPNLYVHETEFLSNTSQINAENIDLKSFPLTANVKFYELVLQPGDCLYMPPKWWHHVRARSESFSVSFWWE